MVLPIPKFLKKNKTSMVPQPPTALIFLSSTNFLFQKFKISLKGCQFESVQNTQEKNVIAANPHIFNVTYRMLGITDHHTKAGEDYFEGDKFDKIYLVCNVF